MPQTVSNPPDPVKSYVVVTLTDGEHIHDTRVIHPDDYGRLNEEAQSETDGELWWVQASDFVFGRVSESFTPLQTVLTDVARMEDSTLRDRCLRELYVVIYLLKSAQYRMIQSRFGESLPMRMLQHPAEIFDFS